MTGYHYNIKYFNRDVLVVLDRDIDMPQREDKSIPISVMSVMYRGRECVNLVSETSILKSVEWEKNKYFKHYEQINKSYF